MVERCVRDAEVASSNLVASILFFACFWLNAGIAQSVEHFTRNEGVVSSSLISSSTRSLMSFRRKRSQAFFSSETKERQYICRGAENSHSETPARLTYTVSCGIMFVKASEGGGAWQREQTKRRNYFLFWTF